MKNIVTPEEWTNEIEDLVRYTWNENSYWVETKEMTLLERRLDAMEKLSNQKRFFSDEYINKKILKRDDEEIALIKKQVEKDKVENPPEDELDNQ